MLLLLLFLVQIPGQMLKQLRYLYDTEVRKLNQRNVQKAIKQMNNQMMDNPNKAIAEVSLPDTKWGGRGQHLTPQTLPLRVRGPYLGLCFLARVSFFLCP